jgi:uncharacterized protein
MGLTIKILKCNGLCKSCYENAIRSKHKNFDYDIEKILSRIEEEYRKCPKSRVPCLHGGEPLLLKFDDVRRLLEKIYSLWGSTSIQTNGTLITDEHIELFEQYRTAVGVSIDGDTWELNYGRWNAKRLSKEEIQRKTDLVLNTMKKMREAGISVSVIALLRKYNARREKIGDFIQFLLRLRDEFGVFWLRTNKVIVHDPKQRAEEELTPDELGEAFCKIADVTLSDSRLQWLPYRDVVDLLTGHYDATCNFTKCDVWHTASERAIMSDGCLSNCLQGGASQDGIQILSASQERYERYEVLNQFPQEVGGCKDCKYWFLCYGGCPAEGIDGDWRNRSKFCKAWQMLFSYVEEKLKAIFPNLRVASDFYPLKPPVSRIFDSISDSTWRSERRKSIEVLKQGITEKIELIPERRDHGDRPHGDHTDESLLRQAREHGDRPHGDKPHGDRAHGDHTDELGGIQ